MDEEEAEKNVTRKEKKIKTKSKKSEKNEHSSMGIHEGSNINDVDAIEHDRVSGKYKIAEMKRDCKMDKAKKNKRGEITESDVEKGTEKGLLTVAHGEDTNVERKRKKTEKNKTRNAKQIEGDGIKKLLDEDANKGRKKRKVKRKREDGDFKNEGDKEVGQHSQNCEAHDTEMIERMERKFEKKKNNHYNSEAKHDDGGAFFLQQKNVQDNVEGSIESTKHDGNATNELERKKKKKKKNKKKANVDNDTSCLMHTDEMQNDEVEHAKVKNKKRKKKHPQLLENGSDDVPDNEVECEKKEKRKKTKSLENGSNDSTPIKSDKKLNFSNQDGLFPIPGSKNMKVDDGKENLVRGKWFTPEEDEIIKDAVLDYIERRDLGEEGLSMVFNCKKHPMVKGCWKEIASALPYRPYISIYYRADKLFHRAEDRNWTQEEFEEIRKYQAKYGNNWRALADELGKFRVHVADAWRRIKMIGRKRGRWSQEEYQKLFDLVNIDLQSKLSESKISRHGMLRDNICWTAISDTLSTRLHSTCCTKWYNQLTSRMVAAGEWADTDDYRLIGALYGLDATCMEDVNWDGLVDDRTGDVCRKRWGQMVLHIGHHGNKSFAEQVEVLAQRYCPSLLKAREIWDSKPRVP